MENYIAVDNVCAWPNLTLLPDGAVVATIFNQPCHGLWEGDVECWGSLDGGRTWRLQGTPAPHDPGTNRMNVAAGLARSDDLVVLASGWTHRPRQGEGTASHGDPARPLRPWVCRSADGGKRWTRTETLALPAGGSDRVIPFGDIVQLHDGCLGVCIYSWLPPDEHMCYLYTSEDDGVHWRERSIIARSNINETTPLVLPSGEILVCARTLGDQHLELFRSSDHGQSWSEGEVVTEAAEHPGHLLALADGRILMTYGRRGAESGQAAFLGIGYRVSEDGGRRWSVPAVLQESGHTPDMAWPHSDGGYPATVELADGTLVTAYYSSCAPKHHDRYHMGVVIWSC